MRDVIICSVGVFLCAAGCALPAAPLPDAPPVECLAEQPKESEVIVTACPPPTLLGALDKATIRRTIKRAAPALHACYERELPKKPDLTGEIVPRFVISPNGRTSQITADKSSLPSTLDACVISFFSRLRFPESDTSVAVSYPLAFRPATRPSASLPTLHDASPIPGAERHLDFEWDILEGEARPAPSFTSDTPEALKEAAAWHFAQGELAAARDTYKRLIAKDPKGEESFSYQYEACIAALALGSFGDRELASEELENLLQMYLDMSRRGAPAKALREAKQRASQLLKESATILHATGQKTRDPRLYKEAGLLYERYLEIFPKAEGAYTISWNYAELLYSLAARSDDADWGEVKEAYQRVITLNPKGKHHEDALSALKYIP